ncbi:MAG: tetratricopeptide repeat protein [Bacteroidota bacterium]
MTGPSEYRSTPTKFSPRILALLCYLLVGCLCSSAADLKKERAEIEGSLASFQLAAAEQLISKMSDRGYQKFYACNLLMYKFFATQDAEYIQQVRSIWKATLATVETIPEDDPLKYVLLSELYCKRSALEFLDQNYLTSIRLARTGRVMIRRNQHRHADNVEQLKILGIMNIVLGAVPAKYQWITHSLGFKGNLQQGLKQLETAATQSSLLKLEAQLILGFVEKNILDRPNEALSRLQALQLEYGGNLVIDYFLATALLGMKKSNEALEILSQRNKYLEEEVFFAPFWDYQLGKAYYFKNDLRNAQRYLARFIKAYKGKLARTDAHFRLGMALTLNNSYELGQQFFKSIATGELSDLDEDAYAQFMATKFLENKPGKYVMALFRARNYFDGGFHEQAALELANIKDAYGILSPAQRIEFHYRQARILHAQGEVELATEQYEKCIAQPEVEESKWLQAYAWFYQASISRDQGFLEQAKQQYKKALEFDGYFYQSGLENRCKASLSELKQAG